MTETRRRLSARPLAWRHLGFRQLTRAWVFTNLADSALYLMRRVTDARGALPAPVVAGDGHVVYRTEGLAFRVAPDHRSAERLP